MAVPDTDWYNTIELSKTDANGDQETDQMQIVPIGGDRAFCAWGQLWLYGPGEMITQSYWYDGVEQFYTYQGQASDKVDNSEIRLNAQILSLDENGGIVAGPDHSIDLTGLNHYPNLDHGCGYYTQVFDMKQDRVLVCYPHNNGNTRQEEGLWSSTAIVLYDVSGNTPVVLDRKTIKSNSYARAAKVGSNRAIVMENIEHRNNFNIHAFRIIDISNDDVQFGVEEYANPDEDNDIDPYYYYMWVGENGRGFIIAEYTYVGEIPGVYPFQVTGEDIDFQGRIPVVGMPQAALAQWDTRWSEYPGVQSSAGGKFTACMTSGYISGDWPNYRHWVGLFELQANQVVMKQVRTIGSYSGYESEISLDYRDGVTVALWCNYEDNNGFSDSWGYQTNYPDPPYHHEGEPVAQFGYWSNNPETIEGIPPTGSWQTETYEGTKFYMRAPYDHAYWPAWVDAAKTPNGVFAGFYMSADGPGFTHYVTFVRSHWVPPPPPVPRLMVKVGSEWKFAIPKAGENDGVGKLKIRTAEGWIDLGESEMVTLGTQEFGFSKSSFVYEFSGVRTEQPGQYPLAEYVMKGDARKGPFYGGAHYYQSFFWTFSPDQPHDQTPFVRRVTYTHGEAAFLMEDVRPWSFLNHNCRDYQVAPNKVYQWAAPGIEPSWSGNMKLRMDLAVMVGWAVFVRPGGTPLPAPTPPLKLKTADGWIIPE